MFLQTITTWKIPSDLSEAKTFAIAIYNIALMGGIAYFLGTFLQTTNVTAALILRLLGAFLSSTVAVGIITGPKILVAANFIVLSAKISSMGDVSQNSASVGVPNNPENYKIMSANTQASIPVAQSTLVKVHPQSPRIFARSGIMDKDDSNMSIQPTAFQGKSHAVSGNSIEIFEYNLESANEFQGVSVPRRAVNEEVQ